MLTPISQASVWKSILPGCLAVCHGPGVSSQMLALHGGHCGGELHRHCLRMHMLLSWDGSTAATQGSSQSMPQKDIERCHCSFTTHHLECRWWIALNPPDSNQIQCTVLEDKNLGPLWVTFAHVCCWISVKNSKKCTFKNWGQGCIAASCTAVLVSPAMPFLPNSVSQGGEGVPAARMQQETRQNGSRKPGQLCWWCEGKGHSWFVTVLCSEQLPPLSRVLRGHIWEQL